MRAHVHSEIASSRASWSVATAVDSDRRLVCYADTIWYALILMGCDVDLMEALILWCFREYSSTWSWDAPGNAVTARKQRLQNKVRY